MHELVGTAVIYHRPVIVKQSKTVPDEKTGIITTTPAVVELRETGGIILAVEAVVAPADGSPAPPPKLQIAFIHEDRLHHVGGSGWRDSFDRAINVRPATDPVVQQEKTVGFYEHDMVDDYHFACARFDDEKAQSEAQAKDAARQVAEQKAAEENASKNPPPEDPNQSGTSSPGGEQQPS